MAKETSSKRKRQEQKDVSCKSADYLKAAESAEAGRHEEALHYIQEYLASSPNDAEALNDAGAILHCIGCPDEAVNHLLKARSLQPDSAEIIWNLSEAYLAIGKAEEAMPIFDDMQRMGILNADVLNRAAGILLDKGNLSAAAGMLRKSLELSPEQDILHPMIEVISRKLTEADCQAGELVK
jgi:tetratricopeptide (TPR) repeat protein